MYARVYVFGHHQARRFLFQPGCNGPDLPALSEGTADFFLWTGDIFSVGFISTDLGQWPN